MKEALRLNRELLNEIIDMASHCDGQESRYLLLQTAKFVLNSDENYQNDMECWIKDNSVKDVTHA